MITLREFLKMIRDEQYRIYQPNRDCLIFESYFKIHSPYYFDNEKDHVLSLKDDYWDNNDYCRGVYEKAYRDPAYDEETADFLEHYGDMEVFSVECGSFKPMKMYKSGNDLKLEEVKDPARPGQDYLPCFNIFIGYFSPDRIYGCEMCYHSVLKDDPSNRNGCSRKPDPKDVQCKKCWRFIEEVAKNETSNS